MWGKRFFIASFIFLSAKSFSQEQLLFVGLTAKLDSVRMNVGPETHFAELYLKTTISADHYIETLPEHGQLLMKRLEESFAEFFFRALEANSSGERMPVEWKNYFSGKELSVLQLKLLGANAHINGDIWQAMTGSFSPEEIKTLKPFYKNYNRSIARIFDDLFETAIESDKRLHNLHSLTFGLDRVYGKMVLCRWRNRQLKLATHYYSNKKKFTRLKRRTENKMKKIDKVIMKRLR